MQYGTQLNWKQLNEVSRAVRQADQTCDGPMIHLVTACPDFIRKMHEGICVLAFSTGASLDERDSLAYPVYLTGNKATAYDQILGGPKNYGGSPFKFTERIGGCLR